MANILLVEDDASARDMIERTLHGEGHSVTAVGNGGEALEEAERSSFDLVVSDVSMPEVDGVTMAETLLKANSRQPLILMSAIADELARASSLSGESVRVLSKPISLDKLRAEVRAVLGDQQS